MEIHYERHRANLRKSLKRCEALIRDTGLNSYSYRKISEYVQDRGGSKEDLIYLLQAYEYLLAKDTLSKIGSTKYEIFIDVFGKDLLLSTMADLGISQDAALHSALIASQVNYHLHRIEMAGDRKYEISPGLSRQLQDTELRGLTSEDLRLPYEAILLISPADSDLRVWNHETGWHRLECIYICEDDSEEMQENRVWRFLVIGSSKNTNVLDDAVFFFCINLPPGESLTDVLDKRDDYLQKSGKFVGEAELMNKEWRRIFHWALNVIVYATWPDAERENIWLSKESRQLWERAQKLPKGSAKKEKILKQLKGANQDKRTLLGKSIINRGAYKSDSDPDAKPGKTLNLKVRVQGHWKKQSHGPKSSLRKTIWIQPYWKGPEDGALGSATHRLVGTSNPVPLEG